MSDVLADRWKHCKEIIQHRLNQEDAAAWLPALELTSISPEKAVLSGIPNPFFKNRIGHQFAPLLRQCLAESFGQTRFEEDFQLELRIGKAGPGRGRGGGATAAAGEAVPAGNVAAAQEPEANGDMMAGGVSRPETADARFSFDTFVEGPSNRLALKLARDVAAHPGGRRNPLFIVAGVGLGKTHLLRAIAHEAKRRSPQPRVIYRTAEEFTNEVVDGIRQKRMKALRNRYRTVDMLLLDDVEFLLVSVKAQEELLHTFDAVQSAGGQLVFGSNRFPAALEGLNPTLLSRLEAGLATELGEPEQELRLGMLKMKARAEGVPLSAEAAQLLVRRISTGFRRLEGALVRLAAYASMLAEPITPDFVNKVAEPLFDPEPLASPGLPVAGDLVLGRVCDHFGITMKTLRSRERTARIARARGVAVYLLREAGALSYPEIGAALGGRSHSTILHAMRKIERELAADPHYRRAVNGLLADLQGGGSGAGPSAVI